MSRNETAEPLELEGFDRKPKLEDIPDSKYFKLPHLDQSQIKQFHHNPADWAWSRLHKDGKTTQAMNFGTAFHAFMMGTGVVVSLPEGETFQKKANREWRDSETAAGHIVVSYPELQTLKTMKGNLPDEFMEQVDSGMAEQCITWTDAKTGLPLKAKPDLIPAHRPYLVDFKTSSTVHPDDFPKRFYDFGYHIQAEFYRAAVSQIDPKLMNRDSRVPDGMHFWCFEKEGSCTFRSWTFSADNPLAEDARMQLRHDLNAIADAVREGERAGMGKGLDAAAEWCLARYARSAEDVELSFPDWVLRDAEAQY